MNKETLKEIKKAKKRIEKGEFVGEKEFLEGSPLKEKQPKTPGMQVKTTYGGGCPEYNKKFWYYREEVNQILKRIEERLIEELHFPLGTIDKSIKRELNKITKIFEEEGGLE